MPFGTRGLSLKEKIGHFIVKVPNAIGSECWHWTGCTRFGYARLFWKQKVHTVTKLAYREFVGDYPENMDLDHLCRNRTCVNPAHLEPVTRKENVNRGLLKKTHCKHGHILEGNVYYTTRRGGQVRRACKICMKNDQKRYRERKRA